MGIFRNCLQISRLNAQPDSVLFKVGLCKIRVVSRCLHVKGIVVHHGFILQIGEYVLRCAGVGVAAHGSDHTTDLKIGIDAVPQLYGTGGCHELIMQTVEDPCRKLRIIGRGHAQRLERCLHGHVDLVEGDPVFDFPFVALEQHPAVFFIDADHAAVMPAAELVVDCQWCVKMADGYKRLNVVLQTCRNHIVVVAQCPFVRLLLRKIGKHPGQCDGKTKHRKSHFRQQCDVLPVGMVKINAPSLWEVLRRLLPKFGDLRIRNDSLTHDLPVLLVDFLDNIGKCQGFSVCVVGTLRLTGGNCPAPEEIFGK